MSHSRRRFLQSVSIGTGMMVSGASRVSTFDLPDDSVDQIMKGSQGSGARPSRFFRYLYGIHDATAFCNASVCADFLNNGKRQIVYANRSTQDIQLVNGADGQVIWSTHIRGADQQSMMAYDLNHDGKLEIVYSTSGSRGYLPRLFELEGGTGKILRSFEVDDLKLGNSPVIIDGDGDGILDGYFGSRTKYLIRMNAEDFRVVARRPGWAQCGCYTSAVDVDKDGKWDLFAGSGDGRPGRKGAVYRCDPVTLEPIWSSFTNANAASSDMIIDDIDMDGQLEILKTVDNESGDDAPHVALYAFKATDGRVLWKVPGLTGEYSPNVADIDGDGKKEIVGATFGGEVYCLDPIGRLRWRKVLRPELPETPQGLAMCSPTILCDINGDGKLEIIVVTNGKWFDISSKEIPKEHGIVFALSAQGEVLDYFDVGGPRFWGHAICVNVDGDPYMELVLSGTGGMDVIKTKGLGPNTEHFMKGRTYRRNNIVPWAYEDSYFIYRGKKQGVTNSTDNLVLEKVGGKYREAGSYLTELLTLPPDCFFDLLAYEATVPTGTKLRVNILDKDNNPLHTDVANGAKLHIGQPARLEFLFSTMNPAAVTPLLDSYSLSFSR